MNGAIVILAFLGAGSGALAASHEPIHPAGRFFTPGDLRSALGRSSGSGLLDQLLRELMKDPDLLERLLKIAARLGRDGKLPQGWENLDPRLREAVRRLAEDPKLREQLLRDPRLGKAAERLADRLPPELRAEIERRAAERAEEALDRERAGGPRPKRTGADGRPEGPGDGERFAKEPGRLEQTEGEEKFRSLPAAPLPELIEGKSAAKQMLSATKAIRRLAGPLRESPTLLRTLAKLQNRIPWGEAGTIEKRRTRLPRFEGAPRLAEEFNKDRWNVRSITARLKDRLGGDLSSMASLPQLPRERMPSLRSWTQNLPTFGSPSVADAAPALALGGGTLPLVIALLLGLLGAGIFWLWRSGRPALARPVSSRRRAEWDGSDRGRIRRAFEELARNLLGPAAVAWNHRRIAAGWQEAAPSARVQAQDLTALYEQARYAPPEDGLEALAAERAERAAAAVARAADVDRK